MSYKSLVTIIFLVSAAAPFFFDNKLFALVVWLFPAFMLVLDKNFRKATAEIYRNFWRI